MDSGSKIYVAGHKGLAGSAICRHLRAKGFTNLLTRSRSELDLRRQSEVERFFETQQPGYVFLAAARVGGIYANSRYPADFLADNLAIQSNVIDAAFRSGVRKLVFLGSSCIYPRQASQPIKEEYLLTGELEPTNEWYAIAKIAGIKMVQAYRQQHGFNGISLMPTNLYGPGDNFDLLSAHVLPALIRKCHEAKMEDARQVTVWGTGQPRREFLHIDDFASAAVFLMRNYDEPQILNVGVGHDLSIRELAEQVCEAVGFRGNLAFDPNKPDGTPRKLLDVTRLNALGWKPAKDLRTGIAETYGWYLQHSTTALCR